MKHSISNRLILFALISALAAFGVRAFAADYVQPQAINGASLYREATSIAYTTNVYFTQGASLLFTNMVAYSTADLGTNSVVQGLDGVTIQVGVSESATATGVWYTGAAISAAAGTWTATVTNVPAVSSVYWQLKLTDASTNVYYYEKQIIRANTHL